MVHAVPSQCWASVVPRPAAPTAHASLADTEATSFRKLSSPASGVTDRLHTGPQVEGAAPAGGTTGAPALEAAPARPRYPRAAWGEPPSGLEAPRPAGSRIAAHRAPTAATTIQ